MFRFIFNFILIIASVSLFFIPSLGISAKYNEIKNTKAEIDQYRTMNTNAEQLTKQRDELDQRYNSFSDEEKTKILHFLPDNIDSVRYILEVEDIARKFGMPIKDVKFSTNSSVTEGDTVIGAVEKPYGVFSFEFTTEGPLDKYIQLLQEIEKNLRMMDIKTLSFGAEDKGSIGDEKDAKKTPSTDSYAYSIKMQSYWLK